MNEIEITVRANFSAKISVKKIARWLATIAIALGLLSQQNFAGFKIVENPLTKEQPTTNLKSQQLDQNG
ncbi:hypothetical protein D3C77_392920 [compost metagenome]